MRTESVSLSINLSVSPSPCCFTQSTVVLHLLLFYLLLLLFGSGCLLTGFLRRPLLLRPRPGPGAAGLVQVRVDENFSVAPPVDHSAAHTLPGKEEKEKVWSVCYIIMSPPTAPEPLAVGQFEWRRQEVTFSSRRGPGRRGRGRGRGLARAPSPSLRPTGGCSWETELETWTRWSCGRLSLEEKGGEGHTQLRLLHLS